MTPHPPRTALPATTTSGDTSTPANRSAHAAQPTPRRQSGSCSTRPASTCAASRRDKQARFTTLALPVVLLVAFVSVGGGNKTFVQDGQTIKTAVFFVPGLIALAVISASFSNLLTDLVAQRDSGVLKRRRATPVPAFALIGGRTLTAAAISLATAVLLLLAGGNVYDITIPNHALPAVAVTILFGSVTFSALAYALAPSIRSSTAIQPVIQLILLPLYAISGVLLPNSKNPRLAQPDRKRPTPPTPRPRTPPRLRPDDARHRAEHRRPRRPQRLGRRRPRPRHP